MHDSNTKLVNNKLTAVRRKSIKIKWKPKCRDRRHNEKIVTRLPTSHEPTWKFDQFAVRSRIFVLTKCLFITCHRPVDRRQIYGLMLTSDRNRNFDFAICLAGNCLCAVGCAMCMRACKHPNMAIIHWNPKQWATLYVLRSWPLKRASWPQQPTEKPIYKWRWQCEQLLQFLSTILKNKWCVCNQIDLTIFHRLRFMRVLSDAHVYYFMALFGSVD